MPIKQLISTVCLTALGLPALAANPIVTNIFTADPSVVVDNGRLYMYTGRDEAPQDVPGYRMNEWRVFSTCDMKHWVDHGVPANLKTFAWATSDAFAVDVVKRDGKFYLYAPVKHATVPGVSIGVAVSDSPTGPFKDARGSALITNDMTKETPNDWDDIDPAVFIDDDGQAYLHYGSFGRMVAAKLNDDMISINGKMRETTPQGFFEGPFLTKRSGTYYEIYSAGSNPATIDYSTSSGPKMPRPSSTRP